MKENKEEKKLTVVEKQEEKLKKLQQEIITARKKIELAKNKETLKIWKKIKTLFYDDEIISKLSDKDFIDEIYLEIEDILNKYKTKKEIKENDLIE